MRARRKSSRSSSQKASSSLDEESTTACDTSLSSTDTSRPERKATKAATTASSFTTMSRKLSIMALALCVLALDCGVRYVLHKYPSILSSATMEQRALPTTSMAFIEQLQLKECRFAELFDPSRFYFNLNEHGYVTTNHWRNDNKAYTSADDPEETKDILHDMANIEQDRARRTLLHKFPRITKNITYVHVGKAGGSSISCNIRYVRGEMIDHCDQDEFASMPGTLPRRPSSGPASTSSRETALSRHVNCYTHRDASLLCYEVNDVFLVNTRNPLLRIASWFLYEHVENHDFVYDDREYHCGQLVLNSCYRDWGHLIERGLGMPAPAASQPLRVGLNLTREECSHWAWATVQGTMPADYHNAWNYEWYHYQILERRRHQPAQVYALRIEHLPQDWKTIDQLLGGTGDVPTSIQTKQNSAQNKPLRITDYNMTQTGMANLCVALLEEMQMYKNLLEAAVNLQPSDVEESLQELRHMCPNVNI